MARTYELAAAAAWFFLANGCGLAENYLDPSGPRYAGDYAQPTTEIPDELGIVTFNIRFGESYEQAAEELATDERLSSADVVLLQEMDDRGTDAIAERLGMNYIYYPGSVHDHGRDFGNAILARWPIIDDAKLILPHRDPRNGRVRIAVRATVDLGEQLLRLYSVHNETPWLGPRARLEQAQAVLADAQDVDSCTVIGGDFNTSDPGSVEQTVELFAAENYDWASADAGDTAGAFKLDHLFVKHLRPRAAGTVGTAASDHRPQWVLAEFIAQ